MAKKIRFALEMKDGTEVRTIEELRENFSLEKVMFYLSNGKLVTWLKDRYFDDLAAEVEALEADDNSLPEKLCEIFDVEYDKEAMEDLEKAAETNRKKELLKNYTTEDKYFDVVEKIAFDQDELYDLLDEDESTIYLCGEKFSVPISKTGVTYIGVNKPMVVISSKEIVDFEEKNISFENIVFDEKYQELLHADEEENRSIKTKAGFSFATKNAVSAWINSATKESFNYSATLSSVLSLLRQEFNNSTTEDIEKIKKTKRKLKESYLDSSWTIAECKWDDNDDWSSHYTPEMIDYHCDSRSDAVNKGEARLKAEYDKIKSSFNHASDNSMAKAVTEGFFESIKNDVYDVVQILYNLSEDTVCKNKEQIELVVGILKDFKQTIRSVANKELDKYSIQLESLDYYKELMEYSDSLYDGMYACNAMYDVFLHEVDLYEKSVSNCFKEQIIAPIVDLLNRIK